MARIWDVRNVRVYDPKEDGLDFQTWTRACEAVRAINQKAEYRMDEGLFAKVSGSEVFPGVTLDVLLKKFFEMNPKTVAVIFMDGKFHSMYGRESYKKVDLDALARNANAIPFTFSYDPEIEQYLKEREATDAAAADFRR